MPEALKLRGRLQFAEGQLVGQIGKLCLKEITDHASATGSSTISARLKGLLKLFQLLFVDAAPRKICGVSASSNFIFTDACYEPTRPQWKCGLGGIIYNSDGVAVQAFSYCLSQAQIAALGGMVKLTIIFEAELLALIVSFVLWKNLLCNSPVVFYVDNNSARDVAISANSRSKMIASLVEQLLSVEDFAACFSWFARVSSPSNPADDPSRGETAALENLGVPFVDVGDTIADCISKLSNFSVG